MSCMCLLSAHRGAQQHANYHEHENPLRSWMQISLSFFCTHILMQPLSVELGPGIMDNIFDDKHSLMAQYISVHMHACAAPVGRAGPCISWTATDGTQVLIESPFYACTHAASVRRAGPWHHGQHLRWHPAPSEAHCY